MPNLGPRLANRLAAWPLSVAARVLPALPSRAAVAVGRALGTVLYALDARGRRASRDNLRAVFGDELSGGERRRIALESYRNVATVETLLFHLQPITPERFRRFVHVEPGDEELWRLAVAHYGRMVVASGHFGNWEVALAARTVFPFAPPLAYLAETTGLPAVDALFERLRDRGSGGAAMRKNGAMALKRALAEGRSVALLADRNVTSRHGGEYVPFLGIPARTTPLPARLARWYSAPLFVALALPVGRARWRLWISGDLMGAPSADEDADVEAATRRMNDVLSRAIREHPASWAWMIKRWKSRPHPELGPYPSYSLLDRD